MINESSGTTSAARRLIGAQTVNRTSTTWTSTEMASAIRAALEGQPELPENTLRQVVFITDGSVGNEDALFKLISDHLGPSRLFTVGIGSAPNSYFMRKAAQFGRGTFTYPADGASWEGPWRAGEPSGAGAWRFPGGLR